MNRRPDGILLVDKPGGPTSHDVVARVRHALAPGARGADRARVGHAGTLDPLATGLLVVLVGKGTRLAAFLSGLDKRYTAEVRFGVATDTLDREGEVVATSPVPPTLAGLDAALASLTGEIDAGAAGVFRAQARRPTALHAGAQRRADGGAAGAAAWWSTVSARATPRGAWSRPRRTGTPCLRLPMAGSTA